MKAITIYNQSKIKTQLN